MSQRRLRAQTLKDNAYSTSYPAPPERTVDISTLNGGLNFWELDYRMDLNQSPDCLNVYWKDGCLSSRQGQEYAFDPLNSDVDYGAFHTCYERPWQGYMIAHKGTGLYKIDVETGAHTLLLSNLANNNVRGSFFVFGEALYYLSGAGDYIRITNASSPTASRVIGYIPTVAMNRTPSGSGGDTYQPENRISSYKRVLFTSDGTSADYYLPYQGLDSTGLDVKVLTYASGAYSWVTYTEVADVATATGNVYQVDRTNGVVKFKTAPAQTEVQTPNNVDITISKSDTATMNSIMLCRASIVYGGGTSLAIVLGGTPAQPNAYFWSGNTSIGLDPTYFPFDYYNFAGSDANEYITGFGRQQNMLVIFQERSIGKSYFSITTIDERDYLKLPYNQINNSVGCDVGKSIRLVQNNLVFANTYGGVYVLLDTTSAGENTVKRISRNINGDRVNKGILKDLSADTANASSYDDNQRYWIVANGNAYLWDYTVKGYSSKEGDLTWFLFDNINAKAWFKKQDAVYYGALSGAIVEFVEQFSDFGGAITRRYAFSTLNFGTYEYLKDVLKMVFTVRSDTDSVINISYKTDWEIRADRTPIRSYSYRLAPRDLTHRSLHPILFAETAVRKPRCFHVKHFQVILTNSEANTDMSLVSAQIKYRFVREAR